MVFSTACHNVFEAVNVLIYMSSLHEYIVIIMSESHISFFLSIIKNTLDLQEKQNIIHTILFCLSDDFYFNTYDYFSNLALSQKDNYN